MGTGGLGLPQENYHILEAPTYILKQLLIILKEI